MTNLLRSYANRKSGWRVAFLSHEGNIVEDRVMVVNGYGSEYLIEADSGIKEEEKRLHNLELKVTKTLQEMEEKDMIYMLQESLMFAVFARAIRSQSQSFVNLLVREKKHDLQMFNNHVEKMVRSLEINYKKLLGEDQIDLFLDEQEDIVFQVFGKFKSAIAAGQLEEFIDYVNSFGMHKGKMVKLEPKSDSE